MGTDRTTLDTLEDLFEYDLQELYYAETELVDALDELADGVTNDELWKAFEDHREETERHVERLEDAFRAIGAEPQLRESATVKGLVEDKRQFDELANDHDLRNLHYLAAGMKAEHVEITSYERLLAVADKLELGDEVTDPLESNLRDEERALKGLQGLSDGSAVTGILDRLL